MADYLLHRNMAGEVTSWRCLFCEEVFEGLPGPSCAYCNAPLRDNLDAEQAKYATPRGAGLRSSHDEYLADWRDDLRSDPPGWSADAQGWADDGWTP